MIITDRNRYYNEPWMSLATHLIQLERHPQFLKAWNDSLGSSGCVQFAGLMRFHHLKLGMHHMIPPSTSTKWNTTIFVNDIDYNIWIVVIRILYTWCACTIRYEERLICRIDPIAANWAATITDSWHVKRAVTIGIQGSLLAFLIRSWSFCSNFYLLFRIMKPVRTERTGCFEGVLRLVILLNSFDNALFWQIPILIQQGRC